MEINLHLHGTDTGNCRDIYSFELDGKVLFVCRVPAPKKTNFTWEGKS